MILDQDRRRGEGVSRPLGGFAVFIAGGANRDGWREVLGSLSEVETFWTAFPAQAQLARFARRQAVVSDAREDIKVTAGKVLSVSKPCCPRTLNT
jgi:hypothetical protein